MITLLAGLAMAAPCLDTDLDEVLAIGGPPYEILADGALRIRQEDGKEIRVIAGDVTLAREDP